MGTETGVEILNNLDDINDFRQHKLDLAFWLEGITNHEFSKADAERVFDFARLYDVEPLAHIEGDLTPEKVPTLARAVQRLQVEHVIWSPILSDSTKLGLLDVSVSALNEGIQPINGKKFVLKAIRSAWALAYSESVFYPTEASLSWPGHFFELGWHAKRLLPQRRHGLAEIITYSLAEQYGEDWSNAFADVIRLLDIED
jgi:hypothetical protein